MYKVVRCPNCRLLQVTGASKSLKCQKCNKSRVFSNLKIYYKSEHPKKCQLVIAEFKKQFFEANEENYDDFFSYNNSNPGVDLKELNELSGDDLFK